MQPITPHKRCRSFVASLAAPPAEPRRLWLQPRILLFLFAFFNRAAASNRLQPTESTSTPQHNHNHISAIATHRDTHRQDAEM
jgi:hypothetical protein